MADPESSLTSLLTTTLEERGILGKVRAELRANVFLAIHEQHGLAGPKGPPAALTSLQADSAGRLATHLVLELMQACGLDYSLSVFGPEANVKGMLAERGQLAEALGLKGGVKADEPLLVQFVRAALPGGGGVSPPPATAEAAIAQQAAIGGGGVSKQVSSSVLEPAKHDLHLLRRASRRPAGEQSHGRRCEQAAGQAGQQQHGLRTVACGRPSLAAITRVATTFLASANGQAKGRARRRCRLLIGSATSIGPRRDVPAVRW